MTKSFEHISDAELIAAVRQGDVAAFGTLYERHLVSAKRAAACLAKTHAEREDLVAESFTRVLRMLREGRGPDEEFRPYLLVTLRNAAIHSATRGAPVSLYADVPDAYSVEENVDPVVDRWHAGVAAGAFASLPERWRMVLWHTEVEEESPAVVAPLLGMRPNSVAALAYRAREGLRQAYLRMHVPEPPRPECRPTVNKLAGYVRHSVPLPLSRKISKHLDRCPDCRERVDTLTKVNTEIAGMLGAVVLGAPLAAAYLHTPAACATAAYAGVGALAATAAVDVGVGVATSVLVVKTLALKAGAAVAIAATAATTTATSASAPNVQPHATSASTTVTEGERESSFTLDRPPAGGWSTNPSTPWPSTATRRQDSAPQSSATPNPATPGAAVPGPVTQAEEQAARKAAKAATKAEKQPAQAASSGSTNAERNAAKKAAKNQAKPNKTPKKKPTKAKKKATENATG